MLVELFEQGLGLGALLDGRGAQRVPRQSGKRRGLGSLPAHVPEHDHPALGAKRDTSKKSPPTS
jgi:hypothetical protein